MRNPLSTIIGDLWAGQKPPTQRKRLGMLAQPTRTHRLLINGTPGINVCEDKQAVLFGKRDRSGAPGEQVPKLILPLTPVVSGDLMKRLGTSRSKRPRPQVGILNIRPRLPEIRHRLRQAEQRVIDLLGRATHLSPPRIPLTRVGEIAGIKVALAQVEHRLDIRGIARHLSQQKIAITVQVKRHRHVRRFTAISEMDPRHHHDLRTRLRRPSDMVIEVIRRKEKNGSLLATL
ncbi:hypothetical protein MYIN104542_30290 [Mycobacterium intermedium]